MMRKLGNEMRAVFTAILYKVSKKKRKEVNDLFSRLFNAAEAESFGRQMTLAELDAWKPEE